MKLNQLTGILTVNAAEASSGFVAKCFFHKNNPSPEITVSEEDAAISCNCLRASIEAPSGELLKCTSSSSYHVSLLEFALLPRFSFRAVKLRQVVVVL